MSIEIPHSTKFVIRQQIVTSLAKPINMFAHIADKKTVNLTPEKIKDYFVVGDLDFKRRYCNQKNNSNMSVNMNQTIGKLTNLQSTNIHTMYEQKQKTKTQQNYRIKTQGNSFSYADGQKRSLLRYQWNRKRQEKVKNYLQKRRLSDRSSNQINSTISYQRQQIQICPNPQLITLINDNVPQYWKNSLRDNQKRLYRHIKGNTFKKQVMQQMLQTAKGRKKLTQSIPSIKNQFISLSKNHKVKNSFMTTFSILGRQSKIASTSGLSMEILNQNSNVQEVPKLICEQVYKIQYSPAYKY